jgi:hypothetical protein
MRTPEAARQIDDARAGVYFDRCMRRLVLVLRPIYVGSALLSLAAAALATASLFIASSAPQSTKFVAISLVVSGVFVLAGVVLFGSQRHVAALVGAVHGPGGASAPALATQVCRLSGYLLAAGAFVCMLLALLAYGIFERIDQGLAVFG